MLQVAEAAAVNLELILCGMLSLEVLAAAVAAVPGGLRVVQLKAQVED